MIKVLIVDDHGHVRQGLGDVFAQTHDISVAAECADGREVVETALLTEPDVVLMDLALPGFTGLEATRISLATRPDMRVVMLTGTVTVAGVCQAPKLGVSGYWGKHDDPGDLATSVTTVAAGNSVWSPAAAAHRPPCNSSPASDPPSNRCPVRNRASSRPLRPIRRHRRSPMGLPEVAVPNRSSL